MPSAEVAAYKELASRMQDLIGHFAWDTYCEQLAKMEKDLIERLVSPVGGENDGVLKGTIAGLRVAVHMPAQIVARAKGMTSNG